MGRRRCIVVAERHGECSLVPSNQAFRPSYIETAGSPGTLVMDGVARLCTRGLANASLKSVGAVFDSKAPIEVPLFFSFGSTKVAPWCTVIKGVACVDSSQYSRCLIKSEELGRVRCRILAAPCLLGGCVADFLLWHLLPTKKSLREPSRIYYFVLLATRS